MTKRKAFVLSRVLGSGSGGSGGPSTDPAVITDVVSYYDLPVEEVVEGSVALLPYGTYQWDGATWDLVTPGSYPVAFTAASATMVVDTFRLDNSFAFVLEP